jgi:hypothetical protein
VAAASGQSHPERQKEKTHRGSIRHGVFPLVWEAGIGRGNLKAG